MVNRVEEEAPEHLAQRGLPSNSPVDQEARLLTPGRIIQSDQAFFELAGVALVGGDGVAERRGLGRLDVVDLQAVNERARVAKLARKQPDEAPGGRGLRMRAVCRLVRGHGPKDAHELRLL